MCFFARLQNTVTSTSAGGIPSFGTTFTYADYGGVQTTGQVIQGFNCLSATRKLVERIFVDLEAFRLTLAQTGP
jgi:hypothetical protein